MAIDISFLKNIRIVILKMVVEAGALPVVHKHSNLSSVTYKGINSRLQEFIHSPNGMTS